MPLIPPARPCIAGSSRALRICTVALLGATLGALNPASAQTPAGPRSAPDLEKAARTIIAAAQYAVFVTLDSTGHPQTRQVQPVAPDSGMVVRFATNPRSRKVAEVERDGRASLHYFDPGSLAYVTLYGRARLLRSAEDKNRYWNPAWTPFYRDRDTSVVLVEVVPERLELVDIKRDIDGDPLTWRAPTLRFPRRPPLPR